MLESQPNKNSPDFEEAMDERFSENPRRLYQRASDALLFVGFLFLSAIAIIALAIATPLVLAISVVAGLFEKNDDSNGWRPAEI